MKKFLILALMSIAGVASAATSTVAPVNAEVKTEAPKTKEVVEVKNQTVREAVKEVAKHHNHLKHNDAKSLTKSEVAPTVTTATEKVSK